MVLVRMKISGGPPEKEQFFFHQQTHLLSTTLHEVTSCNQKSYLVRIKKRERKNVKLRDRTLFIILHRKTNSLSRHD